MSSTVTVITVDRSADHPRNEIEYRYKYNARARIKYEGRILILYIMRKYVYYINGEQWVPAMTTLTASISNNKRRNILFQLPFVPFGQRLFCIL